MTWSETATLWLAILMFIWAAFVAGWIVRGVLERRRHEGEMFVLRAYAKALRNQLEKRNDRKDEVYP